MCSNLLLLVAGEQDSVVVIMRRVISCTVKTSAVCYSKYLSDSNTKQKLNLFVTSLKQAGYAPPSRPFTADMVRCGFSQGPNINIVHR